MQPPVPNNTSSPAPKRFIVLLFDDMNLTFEDLAQAKKAGVEASERGTGRLEYRRRGLNF